MRWRVSSTEAAQDEAALAEAVASIPQPIRASVMPDNRRERAAGAFINHSDFGRRPQTRKAPVRASQPSAALEYGIALGKQIPLSCPRPGFR